MRVNLSDIAQQVGVSVYTVSSTLNGKGRISQKMRERIQKTAQEMGYQPSAAARILKSPKISDIGLLVLEHSDLIRRHAGFQDLNVQFTKECQALGIRHQFEWFDPAASADKLPAMLCDGLVGGVLIAGVLPDRVKELLKRDGVIPHVQIGETGEYSLRFDPSAAVEEALDYLARLGHRAIMLLNGPATIPVYHEMRNLVTQFVRREFAQKELCYCEINPCAPAEEQVAAAVRDVCEASPRPTAVLVAGGPTAKSVIARFLRLGVRVPEDISVVSYEVMDWETEDFFLPITAVEHDFSQLARLAIGLLRERMSGVPVTEQNLLLPERFTVRKTASAPGKHGEATQPRIIE